MVDALSGKVRYAIRKRLNGRRRERERRYYVDDGNQNLTATYFGGAGHEGNEPFARLHRCGEEMQP